MPAVQSLFLGLNILSKISEPDFKSCSAYRTLFKYKKLNHFNLLANEVIEQLYVFNIVILQDAHNFICIRISLAFICYFARKLDLFGWMAIYFIDLMRMGNNKTDFIHVRHLTIV